MASLLSSLLRLRRSSSCRLCLSRLSTLPSPPPPAPSASPSALSPNQVWLDLSSSSASSASSSASSSTSPWDSKLPKGEWDSLSAVLRSFARSRWAMEQALSLYLPSSAFSSAVSKFRLFFLSHCSLQTAHHLLHLSNLMPQSQSESQSASESSALHRFLFPIFAEFCLNHLQADLKAYRNLMDTADLTKPHIWYPFARAMKRKVIYHCGPTNSGKTYNALCRFADAKSGVYCSPLRLLAMEVFDKVNSLGVYCSLHTGQEIKDLPFSNHVACTIEMLSTDHLYEVAVIDEVQMMADPTRGFAWTRALLGLKADEIHLCGDPSVLSIVQNICRDTGDDLQINRYDRFKPLVVEAKTLLGDLRNVQSGDCVVAFSRREIFEVKLAIEKSTKHKCCVIYGALPPETRRQQASLFNNQDNEYDVLVASDAVGMGLNLNIRRVVFYSLAKYNGNKMVPVDASQVKQIAGRAGRRGSVYPDGLVTTFSFDDLDYLIECLKKPFREVKKVGLFPCFEQFELFAAQFPQMPFNELLDKFQENSRLDQSYFFCKQDGVRKVANMLDKVPGLTLKERYNFCFAPVNIRDPKAMYHLLRFATHYSQKKPVSIAMGMPRGSAKNDAELLDLETKHQVLSMYLWLSHHFEESDFPHVEKAESMAAGIAELLGSSLAKACWKPQSRQQVNRNKNNEAGEDTEEKEGSSVEDGGDGYQRPVSFVNGFMTKGEKMNEELEHISASFNFVA